MASRHTETAYSRATRRSRMPSVLTSSTTTRKEPDARLPRWCGRGLSLLYAVAAWPLASHACFPEPRQIFASCRHQLSEDMCFSIRRLKCTCSCHCPFKRLCSVFGAVEAASQDARQLLWEAACTRSPFLLVLWPGFARSVALGFAVVILVCVLFQS